jgi:hypothetical protein
MRARSSGGVGGIPFVDAVNPDTGALLWREELTASSFRGASLVTSISQAPEYGFALALSGVEDNFPGQPFMIARINSFGKFILRSE